MGNFCLVLPPTDSDADESSIPDRVHSSISILLDHLEQEHGYSMVSRALSYLNLSRTGLTDAELADLLAIDDNSAASVAVLQVDVERLLLDLRGFLIRRSVLRLRVLSWVSRHFKLVVNRKYLSDPEVQRQVHSAMADYFGGRDPLPLNCEYQDADECDQSLYHPFDLSSSFSKLTLRKVLELPHHLQGAGRQEEFEQKLLMSPGFHQAMVQVGLLGDLLLMLEAADFPSSSSSSSSSSPSSYHFSRERGLLASILKSSACLLQSSPTQLATTMEMQLLPYREVLPAIQRYIQEIRDGRKQRGSGLGVTLCPALSSVPALHHFKCDNNNGGSGGKALVVEVAGTACGTIALVMDDSTAWFGDSGGIGLAKLLLTFEERQLKFAAVKSSGRFVHVSTRCDKHFLWEVTGPEVFLQVREPPRTGSIGQSANMVEGFVVACRKKVFLRWREGGLVSVFDVSSATSSHFRCEGRVTCLVCSSDGLSVYCGQDDGSAAAFDADGRLLASWTASYHSGVQLMILCEEKGEVACVDRTGIVTVWSIAAVAAGGAPRLLNENLMVGRDLEHVLSTDHLEEAHTLLVCQAHQVTLWGMCDWELWDQFLAPRGRSFAQAVLAQGGDVFLALLDAFPQVLVWRVSTGECVLTLEPTGVLPHKLVKTTSDVMCVSRHGCVTVWSSEMIQAATAAPRMDRAVTAVAVEENGDGFYTSDGSEAVWRWRLASGLPHQHFLHDGPVAKLCLSPGDAHLVTLAGGDVYVWETATGRNLVRAAGSRASDVLVAPSGQLGVSLSETSLSHVWRLAQGGVVCSVHLHLADAQVTPESTFLIGRRRGDLLAASLWSGSVSKRFSCAAGPGGGEEEEVVVAFQTLSRYPDLVLVLVASGALYTWKVAEETVCRHFRLPSAFLCQPSSGSSGFQMSRDGGFALLSNREGALNILDLAQVGLCSIRTEGPVIMAHLDSRGRYMAYVAGPAPLGETISCQHSARPLLQVVRLADGARVGRMWLPRNPSFLLVSCEKPALSCVFVGFEDGAVGVYTIPGVASGGSVESFGPGADKLQGTPPHRWFPLPAPNVTWH